MTLRWTKEDDPRWDADKQRLFGPDELAAVDLDPPAAGAPHLHHHYFIHLLGWTITGKPNGTLHFTHPGGWLTLDSPLPGNDRNQLPDVA